MTIPVAARTSRWVAVAVALGVVVTAFPDVVFSGASLRKSLLIRLFESDLETSAWLPDLVEREVRDGLRDVGATVFQVEPAHRFMRHVLAEGQSPYWNPWNACGTHGPERLASVQFSALTVATALLGGGSFGLHVVLLAAFAFSVYCLFRALTVFFGRSFPASVAACFAFLLSGFHSSMIGSQIAQPYVLSPILLYALLVFLSSRAGLAFLGAVLASALMLAETFLPTTVLVLVAIHALCLAHGVSRWRSFHRDGLRQLARQTTVAVLGFLLLAPLWFPVFEAVRMADWSAYAQRGFAQVRPYAALTLLTPKHFWEAYDGFTRTRGFDASQLPLGKTETQKFFHVGLVVAIVAVQALAVRRFRTHPVVLTCVFLIVVALGRTFGVPPFTLIEHLPFFGVVGVQYWALLICLPVALLLAYGLDALSARTVGKWPTWAVLGFVFSCFFFLLGRLGPPEPGDHAWWHLRIMIGILVAILTVFVSVRIRPGSRAVLRFVVLVLIVGELIFYTNRLRPKRQELDLAQVEHVAYLRGNLDGHRIMNFGHRGLPPNWGSAAQIPQIDSLDGVNFRWYARFFEERFGRQDQFLALRNSRRGKRGASSASFDLEALDLAGVRYLAVTHSAAEPYLRLFREQGFEARIEDRNLTIFENPNPYPRAFAVDALVEAAGIPGDWNLPGREVAVTTDPILLALAKRIGVASETPEKNGSADGPRQRGEVEIEEYRNARVVLETDLSRPSVVVLTDTWHPGWRAEIDGRRVHLGRVDDVFRGVAVPAGRHRIVMTYLPRTFWLAVVVSLLTVAFVAWRVLSGSPRAATVPARPASRTLDVMPRPSNTLETAAPRHGDERASRHLERCIVCDGKRFRKRYPGTFDGREADAVRFFLAGRESAVHGDVVRCAGCGFVFTNPQFAPDAYDRIYSALGETSAPPERPAEARRYADRRRALETHCAGGALLDLGCGDGGFVRSLPPAYRARGFEIRDRADARPTVEGALLYGRFPEAVEAGHLEAESLDVLTAWDVLEHLPELDRYVEAMVRLIRPGGVLVVTVPDVESPAARLGGRKWNCLLLEHLWYFDPATLTRYLRRFGLERRTIDPFPYAVDVDSLVERVRQTYGVKLPVPRSVRRLVLRLPIGLMLGVFVKRAAS